MIGSEPVQPAAASPGPSSDDVGTVLREVSLARHEINNQLTAALTEVQLLLMDGASAELTESYEVILGSLRSIREIVRSIEHLTPKSS